MIGASPYRNAAQWLHSKVAKEVEVLPSACAGGSVVVVVAGVVEGRIRGASRMPQGKM
jgi:hypothetical protein